MSDDAPITRSQIRDNVPDGHEVHPDFQCLGGFASQIQAIFDEELADSQSAAGSQPAGNGTSRQGRTDPAGSSTLRARDAGGGK